MEKIYFLLPENLCFHVTLVFHGKGTKCVPKDHR